jgi:dynein heavy chain, axonemal
MKGHGDFTPLNQWVREHHLFHSLLKIPFFKRYRIWKCFTVWRKTVLHTKIMLAKKSLNKNLFLTHQTLRSAILKIRNHCFVIVHHHRLINIQSQKSYKLKEFVKEQLDWIEHTRDITLKEWEDNIKSAVEEASTQCLNEKGFEIVLKSQLNTSDQQSISYRKLTFTEQAARSSECKRLQRFVKLADYLIINTLHMLTIQSIQDLCQTISRGVSDLDVFVDNRSGTISSRYIENLKGLLEISSSEGDSKSEEAKESFSETPTEGVIQVGGVVVGSEVKTSELIQCGFNGFPLILTRLSRKSIKVHSLDDMDLDHEAPVEMDNITVKESHSNSKSADKKQIHKNAAKDIPLLKMELLIDVESPSKDLHMLPSLPEFMSGIDDLLKTIINSVQQIELLTNKIPYLDPSNLAGGAYSSVRGLEENDYTEGPDVTSIIMNSGYFRELCGRTRGVLVGNFSNAAKWMQTWEPVRNMWIQNENFEGIVALENAVGHITASLAKLEQNEGGVAAFLLSYLESQVTSENQFGLTSGDKKDKSKDAAKNILEVGLTIRPLDDGSFSSPLVSFFEESMAKFSEQKNSMHAIHTSSVINNVLVDTSNLKNILVPSPERWFELN